MVQFQSGKVKIMQLKILRSFQCKNNHCLILSGSMQDYMEDLPVLFLILAGKLGILQITQDFFFPAFLF